MKERQDWDDLQREFKTRKSECILHKCGAYVLDDYIFPKEDVCINCDCKCQPSFANPIFRVACEELTPQWVCLLYE